MDRWYHVYAKLFAKDTIKAVNEDRQELELNPLSQSTVEGLFLAYKILSDREYQIKQLHVGTEITKIESLENNPFAQPKKVSDDTYLGQTFRIKKVDRDMYVLEMVVEPTGWRLWDTIRNWISGKTIYLNKEDVRGWMIKSHIKQD